MDAALRQRGALLKAVLVGRQKQRVRRWSEAGKRWMEQARPAQLPPVGDWHVWLIMAGRGFGKTRCGAEWLASQALFNPGTLWAVIGQKWTHTRDVPLAAIRDALKTRGLVETKTQNPDGYVYNKADLSVKLPNGSEIRGFSAETPDSLRGPNLHGAWCDELAHFPKASQLWRDGLVPAVRLGSKPRILITTTPKIKPLLKELVERTDGSVALVRGSTWDNANNLSGFVLEELRKRYEGTRLGRQELHGELLLEAEHALWDASLIEAARFPQKPDRFDRVIVSVDPSGSMDGDATGIVTVARGHDGIIYVLSDDTCKGSPEHRYEAACSAASRSGAGMILYESAYGGDNIAHGLRSTWQHLEKRNKIVGMLPALKASPTKSSKADRAHPVVALYEQTANGTRKIAHCDAFVELEDEMLTWEPSSKWSPNRIDALVHGVRYLARIGSSGSGVSSFVGMPDLAPIPLG